MPTTGMYIDISTLVEATATGESDQISAAGLALLQRGAAAAELLGRIGMIAAHGDSDGHIMLTLDAAAALSRLCMALPRAEAVEQDAVNYESELPLFVQALRVAAPALRAGRAAYERESYPQPFFPSDLPEGKTVNDFMHDAIYNNDARMVERLLFGLYGTGADYRTMEVRAYEGVATTFQNNGHPLQCAVRGYQLLDAVEWGVRAPHILQWLAPLLPLRGEEPAWVQEVRAFDQDAAHSLASLRARIAAPRDGNALSLRDVILSAASATQVCQEVYDVLIKGGASPQGVGSIIALTGADIMQSVSDGNRAAFVQLAHGLLFSAATRQVFRRVQDVEALPLLFTSAAYINALHKEQGQQSGAFPVLGVPATPFGGGLIAPSMLETVRGQLQARDLNAAFSTARRYLRLSSDRHALFATIGLSAAEADAAADEGHTLQIVQAAAEEFLAWPSALADTGIDGFLHVALRAAAFAR